MCIRDSHYTDEVYEIFAKGLGVDCEIFLTDVNELGDEQVLQVTPFCYSFINQKASLNEFRKRINIPAQEDAFNDIRSEYSGMLQNQLTKGNNGLIKKKYITFGIEADSLRTAKPKLERLSLIHISFQAVTASPAQSAFSHCT